MSASDPVSTALVVGAGSIGRRHLRNLRTLGVRRLAVCDPVPERLAAVVRELEIDGFDSLGAALAVVRPEVVLVCSPPAHHVPQAREAVQAGAHVFVEKPLGVALDGIEALASDAETGGRLLQVGYNMRFHPGLRTVKSLMDRGVIGQVHWARAEFGQYLPDWRPGRHPHDSYTAHRAQGGGVLLDVSHELDYVIWLLGRPVEVVCLAGRVAELTADAEDCATVLLRFSDGGQADVHVDCVQRAYTRTCRLAGATGTIEWRYGECGVRVFQAGEGRWTLEPEPPDAEEMYLAELRAFLGCVAQGEAPSVGIREGAAALRVALAARTAAECGRVERLTW